MWWHWHFKETNFLTVFIFVVSTFVCTLTRQTFKLFLFLSILEYSIQKCFYLDYFFWSFKLSLLKPLAAILGLVSALTDPSMYPWLRWNPKMFSSSKIGILCPSFLIRWRLHTLRFENKPLKGIAHFVRSR